MFIPQGEALYENLATSYVLVDALIEDLCEGGFSGLVEVVLRETDAHIVVDRGKIVVAVEKQRSADYTRASIPRLAEMARRERGRVSVYRYSKGVAAALGGRITAQPLYTGLSSDFTDLNRMIAKFRRESDREWFIEISTASGITSLVHIEDDRCRMITSGAEQDIIESGQLDLAANSSLRRLLEECNNAGGTFDVYFRRAGEPTYVEIEEEPVQQEPAQETATEVASSQQSEPVQETTHVKSEVYQDHSSATAAGVSAEAISLDESVAFPSFMNQPVDQPYNREGQAEAFDSSMEVESLTSENPQTEIEAPPSLIQEPPSDDRAGGLSAATRRLLAMPPEMQDQATSEASVVASSEAEEMAEIKRLMGEIARTVEEAVKSIEQGDSFSMSLRAGQLKVADSYPFLDPFGSEFEYMAGEIVFVGKATPAEFANGLTEAIKLATASLVQSSLQPSRLRAFITEDLNKLLERNLAEFQRYNLDRSIEKILSF